jgi:hypothetical protein
MTATGHRPFVEDELVPQAEFVLESHETDEECPGL